MLFSRLTLRRLAALALLSWVFALGSGVAHACGLLGDAPSGAPVIAMAGHDHTAMGHGDARMAMDADDDGVLPSSHPLCAKFCDSDKASTPEVRLAADPAMQLLVTVWSALTLADPASSAAGARTGDVVAHNRSPQDIPIAFLRLTL